MGVLLTLLYGIRLKQPGGMHVSRRNRSGRPSLARQYDTESLKLGRGSERLLYKPVRRCLYCLGLGRYATTVYMFQGAEGKKKMQALVGGCYTTISPAKYTITNQSRKLIHVLPSESSERN